MDRSFGEKETATVINRRKIPNHNFFTKSVPSYVMHLKITYA